jgi:zinc/manganese transport system substrate-binding protein
LQLRTDLRTIPITMMTRRSAPRLTHLRRTLTKLGTGLVLLVLLVLLAAACGDDDTASGTAGAGDGLTVVVTTSILGDVVREVVGDAPVSVDVVMPAGTDPHEFVPDAQQIAALQGADLVVANGLGLEEGLHDALDQAVDAGVPVLEVAPTLDPVPFGTPNHGGHGDHADEGDDHDREDGDADPHVWQDPARMADAAVLIGDRLAELDPADGGFADRARAYADEILAVDAEVAARYATIPEGRRQLVTNHEAFGYLADRYGLEVVGAVVPSGSTLGEASAADREELLEVLAELEVPVIFTENVVPDDLADSISEAAGRDVELVALVSDALDDDAPTYLDLVRVNADRIVGHLAG